MSRDGDVFSYTGAHFQIRFFLSLIFAHVHWTRPRPLDVAESIGRGYDHSVLDTGRALGQVPHLSSMLHESALELVCRADVG